MPFNGEPSSDGSSAGGEPMKSGRFPEAAQDFVFGVKGLGLKGSETPKGQTTGLL